MRFVLLLMLGAATALAAPIEEEPPFLAAGEPASFDILGGGSDPGAWAVGLSGGYPWSSLRAQVGTRHITPVLVLNTALGRRWEPMVGFGKRLLDRPGGRLSAELLVGAAIQTGTLSKRGPRVEGKLRLMGFGGRVAPWLGIGAGHTFHLATTRRTDAAGSSAAVAVEYEWAPVIEGGLAIAITKHIGLDLGLDWHIVGAPNAIALPGVHLGIQFGGGR